MRWLITRDGFPPVTLVVGTSEPDVVEAIEVAAHRQGIVLERAGGEREVREKHPMGHNVGGDERSP